MLTSKQLQAPEPLTTHAKYGKLLSDAIDVWKREDVKNKNVRSMSYNRK